MVLVEWLLLGIFLTLYLGTGWKIMRDADRDAKLFKGMSQRAVSATIFTFLFFWPFVVILGNIDGLIRNK